MIGKMAEFFDARTQHGEHRGRGGLIITAHPGNLETEGLGACGVKAV